MFHFSIHRAYLCCFIFLNALYVWWSVFCAATVFFFFRTMLLMPVSFFDKNSLENKSNREKSENSEYLSPEGDKGEIIGLKTADTPPLETGSDASLPAITSFQIIKILSTKKFLPFLAMFILTDLRLHFIWQSKNPWLNWLSDNDQKFVSNCTNMWSMLTFLSIIFASIQGFFIKGKKRKSYAKIMVFLSILCFVSDMLKSIKHQNYYLVGMIFLLDVYFRTNFYAALDIFLFSEMPLNVYGRTHGFMFLLGGSLTILQQYFLRFAQVYGWSILQLGLGFMCFIPSLWFYFSHSKNIDARTLFEQAKAEIEDEKCKD